MKRNKFCFLLTIILLASALYSYGQDYIINLKGDTLRGDIKVVIIGIDKKAVLTDADKKKTSYGLFQVKRVFKDGEVYVPVKSETGYTFMKLQKDGYLSLYTFQLPNETAFEGQLLVKKDGTSLQVPNLNFKKMMKKFLEECDPVTDSLDANWSKRDLFKIIDTYNQWISSNTTALQQSMEQQQLATAKTNVWDQLQTKVKAQPDFEGKNDAIEMITDIKGKVERGDKIPKFLIDGLKASLQGTDTKNELEMALQQLGSN